MIVTDLVRNAKGQYEEHPPASCPACGTLWGPSNGTVSPGWEFCRTWQCRSCGYVATESGRSEPVRFESNPPDHSRP